MLKIIANVGRAFAVGLLTCSYAQAADDVIVNGLHCNALCQSWMGVRPKAAALTAPAAAPLPTHAEAASSLEEIVAPAISGPPHGAVVFTRPAIRVVTVGKAVPNLKPRAVASIAPIDRIRADPAIEGGSVASPSQSLTGMYDKDRAVPVIAPRTSVGVPTKNQQPKLRMDQQDVTPGDVAAPYAGQPSTGDAVPTQSKPRGVRPELNANSKMEPGLKGLPRLSDVVAVSGVIMVELPEDRAERLKQLARLLKETTRPKPDKQRLTETDR